MKLSLGIAATAALASLQSNQRVNVQAFTPPLPSATPVKSDGASAQNLSRYLKQPTLPQMTMRAPPQTNLLSDQSWPQPDNESLANEMHASSNDLSTATNLAASNSNRLCDGELANALQNALGQFIIADQSQDLTHLLTQNSDRALARHFAENNMLLHTSINRQHIGLFNAALSTGIDPNHPDAQGNTPLHHAQQQPNDYFIQTLVDYGADLERMNNDNHTPLQIAAKTNHYSNVISLLKGGAELRLQDDYFQSEALTSNHSTDHGSPAENAEMQNFLLNIKLLFQLKDIKTDGLEIKNEILAKEKLVAAISSDISPRELFCCHKSIALDLKLRTRCFENASKENMQRAYALRCDTLSQAMAEMEPHDFLWLSNGATGHAINTVVYKNLNGDFEVSIINSGEGSEHHESNELHQIKPKTYRFQPPAGIDATRDRSFFNNEVIRAIGSVYTVRYEKGLLSIDNLYKTMDLIADYQRQLTQNGEKTPSYTRIVHKSGPPIDHQMADNCSTMSLLGAMLLLFPEAALNGELVEKYENYLLNELTTACPTFTREQYAEITHLAQQQNDIDWVMQKARMLYAKACRNAELDQATSGLLNECTALFEQAHKAEKIKADQGEAHDVTIIAESADMLSFIRRATQAGMTPGVFATMLQDPTASW